MHISGQRPITQTPGLQPWSKKSAPSKAQQPIDKTYNGLLVCPGENLTTLSLVEKSPPPKREVFSLGFDSEPHLRKERQDNSSSDNSAVLVKLALLPNPSPPRGPTG